MGLMRAKKIDTLEVYAASGTAYWVSTTRYDVVAGAGKRLFVLYGTINRNVSSTLTVSVKNVANDIVQSVDYLAAGTGISMFPHMYAAASTLAYPVMGMILDPGEYLNIVFGTAQDTSSWVSITVLEIDI